MNDAVKTHDTWRSAQRRRLVLHDRPRNLKRRIAPKRRLARQHFVEDDTHDEQIAPSVDHAPLDHFGRHVARRAQQYARQRQIALMRSNRADKRTGKPKIEQLHNVP